MSHNEEHHHESPKRVYFGIPFAFAFAFWLIIFLCLKASDGPKNGCCKKVKNVLKSAWKNARQKVRKVVMKKKVQ